MHTYFPYIIHNLPMMACARAYVQLYAVLTNYASQPLLYRVQIQLYMVLHICQY